MRYTHFSKTERMELSILRKKGYALREIARELGRSPSSVSRELNRNQVQGQYHASKAQHKAYVARKYSKYQGMKIREHPWLEEYVRDKLEQHWTPEEIAGRLELEYGYPVISFKAIYKWLYSQYGQQYCRHLPSRSYRPRRRKGKKPKKQIIPNRVSIEDRPRIISVRRRCGDFEGDTLGVPKTSTTTLAALADRKSRYFLAKKIARLRYAMDGSRNSPIRSLYILVHSTTEWRMPDTKNWELPHTSVIPTPRGRKEPLRTAFSDSGGSFPRRRGLMNIPSKRLLLSVTR